MASADPRLPPWLRGAPRRPPPRLGRLLPAVLRAAAVLGAGVAFGWWLRGAPPIAAAPAPPVVCPLSAACPTEGARQAASPAPRAAARPKTRAPVPPSLTPLPAAPPLDEDARRAALREFAQGKASELRECVAEPDQGPVRRVGAAFEIDERGAVAAVQVLGGDGLPSRVTRCCGRRLRDWQFPRELLGGERSQPASLLVSFVF